MCSKKNLEQVAKLQKQVRMNAYAFLHSEIHGDLRFIEIG